MPSFPLGFIFDFDGVLVNSEHTHLEAVRAAGATMDLRVSDDRYFGEFVAFSDRDIFVGMAADAGRTLTGDELAVLLREKWRLFSTAASSGLVRFFPGAKELVLACAGVGPTALCTAASRRTIELMLGGSGLLAAFKATVTSDDVTRNKPDPEPYRKAARLLGVEPKFCAVVEDTQGGAASALGAGCKVAAVCHTLPAHKHAGVHVIVEKIAELTPARLAALVGR